VLIDFGRPVAWIEEFADFFLVAKVAMPSGRTKKKSSGSRHHQEFAQTARK
jgi:hypothetical protein